MRLLLFSDLHLDARFAWLAGRPDLAALRRQGLRETLLRIVELAASERVDALLCGGDLYEQERYSPDTLVFLESCIAGLSSLPIFIAPGNHDWLGPASLYAQAAWPPHVHLFQEDRLQAITLADGLTLWGAAHRAPANTDGFLDGFRVDRGGVHLALFHGSEQGALGFQESGKAPHAPFRLEQIAAAGIHHACLGHFHRPRATEHSTYPGNPDPLTFGEDGQRGAVLLTVHADGRVDQEWRDVASTRLHAIDLDVSGCRGQHEVREQIDAALEGREGFIRVTLHGEVDPDTDLRALRQLRVLAPRAAVLVRTDGVRLAYDLEAIARESTVRGQFVRDVMGADLDETTRQRVLTTGLRALDGREDLEA